MSRALYRKYRSKSLAEVVGQDHITKILGKAIKSGRISHAYLLTGPRGVGKTSIARILAHEINGLPYSDDSLHLDIIEIDAASNNGVEDVRALREKVQIAPVSAPKKVYIIDEVHMLSKPAFNALLKTLEEPPEHVVFILATTDVDKLPATIISRTQRFSFRAISPKDATAHLKSIAQSENIKISDDAAELLALRGDGSFRDSISLLDQLSSLTDEKEGITTELVEMTLGLAPAKLVQDVIAAVEHHDTSAIIALLDQATGDGISAVTLAGQLAQHLRGLAAEKPQLLKLLDALLDVPRSSQPDLKLLSVLGSAATPDAPVKTVALAAPVREIHASVKELRAVAEPIEKIEPGDAQKLRSVREDKATATPEELSEASIPQGVEGPTELNEDSVFDWAALIEYVHKHHAPLYAIMSKCEHGLEDNELTIYTKSAFYKKKLDDAKYLPLLYESLNQLGSSALTVHILPTAPPPKSSQAAAVAAIMGGGEEVELEAEPAPAAS